MPLSDQFNYTGVALRCSACKFDKPEDEFHRNKKMASGRNSQCKQCSKDSVTAWRQNNPERQRQIALRRSQKLRRQVLCHYGGTTPTCTCCGETTDQFLCIDHIHSGGNQHRREVGSGSHLYQWLHTNGYPEGFQVLCHNCNMAKGIYGVCPHQHVNAS
jgi:hypothetical protein